MADTDETVSSSFSYTCVHDGTDATDANEWNKICDRQRNESHVVFEDESGNKHWLLTHTVTDTRAEPVRCVCLFFSFITYALNNLWKKKTDEIEANIFIRIHPFGCKHPKNLLIIDNTLK